MDPFSRRVNNTETAEGLCLPFRHSFPRVAGCRLSMHVGVQPSVLLMLPLQLCLGDEYNSFLLMGLMSTGVIYSKGDCSALVAMTQAHSALY